jgi:hypothetical protein
MLLQMTELYPSYGWTVSHCVHVPHFLSSWMDGHLGCLGFLAIMNSAAINLRV